jgi:antitoxin PrlF
MATTVTSKGQVTIPKPVRDHLGIVPGSQVEFRRVDDGSIVIEKAEAPAPRPSRLASLRGHAGRGMSTDQIMALLRGD